MPKSILIDLNVILDVFLERPGFEASRDILDLQRAPNYELFISAHIITTFTYILESAKVPRVEIVRHVVWLLESFSVVPTTTAILRAAAHSQIKDFEDAAVEQAALFCQASAIITRNVKDFKKSAVTVIKPETYLED